MVICYSLVAINPSVIRFAEWRFWSYFILAIFGATVCHIASSTIRTALKNPEQWAKLGPSAIPGVITSVLTFLLLKNHPNDAGDPFFMMSLGYVLQYLSQIFIVARLTGRPVRKLFDPTLIALWAGQTAYLVIPGLAGNCLFWKIFFGVVIGLMVVFDVRVATGLAEGLHIRIFSLKKLD
jgi:hypothetical protein